MKRVVFDCETDGLLPELTKIHCLVLRDLDTDEVMSCANQPAHTGAPIFDGLEVLAEAEVIYGHNAIGFDVPAIQKVYPNWKPKGIVRDTFVIASMVYAHIKDDDFKRVKQGKMPAQLAGRHSLEAWGHRLGNWKGDYKGGWDTWSPEMQTYCEQDTAVTRSLVIALQHSGLSAESVETELELRAYLIKQEENGWPFDVEKAVALQGVLAERRQKIARELIEVFGSWEQPILKLFVPKKDDPKKGYVKGVPFQKYKTVEFNPSSRDHIANRLKALYGWEPTVFTEGGAEAGKAKVDETTLTGLDYPTIPLIQEYLMVDKRLGQLAEGKEAWLNHLRLNKQTGLQHIHGRVKQNEAITHRASHSKPNISQVPKVGNEYGAECRELWCVPEGWVQIGADASGLEARCLGHYVAAFDGGAYGELLLKGDVHTKNRIALGFPETKKGRDDAKTWYYAWMFGAGDEKLGRMSALAMGITESVSAHKARGAAAKKAFLNATPALKYLIDEVQRRVSDPGYVFAPDGRRTYIRSAHAALNSLIQSAGAIICKRWIVVFNRRLIERFGPQGWDGQWAALCWSHDEVQLAVRPEIAEEVCRILMESIESLTEHFSWRVPLSGEAKRGRNWKETH